MTPRIGPRCRIAALTTDLPLSRITLGVHSAGNREERQWAGSLPPEEKGREPGLRRSSRSATTVIDFCRHCRKCALACPGNAIPFGDETESGGVRRWRINHENCYTYWCQAGADCGRCMIVCPFSHPDNWFHALVRFGIRNNLIFRRLALPLDNLFYGKKPSPRRAV